MVASDIKLQIVLKLELRLATIAGLKAMYRGTVLKKQRLKLATSADRRVISLVTALRACRQEVVASSITMEAVVKSVTGAGK